MTLLRQLVIVIVTLFLLLFVGTLLLSISNTRDYLNQQLRTITQDTATSLGLTLSPPMADKDMAVVDRMISAVSDSGYYREVLVSDVEGKTLISRTQQVKLDNVPQWFVDRVPLKTPVGEALIMAGWQQAGTVRVEANPGYAYAALWSNSVESFWWFLGASTVTFLLGLVALHFILRPLRDVEMQARAICDREYPVQKKLPWTLELRSVVVAMNRMSSKVKEMFEEQAATVDRLREENYRDAATGLANRAFFDMQLKKLSESKDEVASGALLLLELNGFKEYNDKHGFKAGDDLLQNAAGLIGAITKSHQDVESFAARLGGANFAVMLKNVSEQEALDFARQIANDLPRFKERGFTDTEEVGHIGVAIYHGQSAGELLSAADTALRAAQTLGPNAVYIQESKALGAAGAKSATQWRDILQKAIADASVKLQFQPVKDAANADRILHYELLMRLMGDDGELIPAGIFVPMAKRFGMLRDLDKIAVSKALAYLEEAGYVGIPLAINLFPASLQDTLFVDWLCGELAAKPEAARMMQFEVSEYGVVENLDALRDFIQRLAQTGAHMGLDHFGRGFSSFGYLSTLKIDYLKIDGSYMHDIESNKNNQFFVESIIKIAHGLDIQVIAESVESQQEWETLATLRVDGVQGYGVGRPESF
jgi:diguanylate cyclase (GGDEF)-like protein